MNTKINYVLDAYKNVQYYYFTVILDLLVISQSLVRLPVSS